MLERGGLGTSYRKVADYLYLTRPEIRLPVLHYEIELTLYPTQSIRQGSYQAA